MPRHTEQLITYLKVGTVPDLNHEMFFTLHFNLTNPRVKKFDTGLWRFAGNRLVPKIQAEMLVIYNGNNTCQQHRGN
ncbi:hypothetical protein D3C80_844500 [compost metagenome]